MKMVSAALLLLLLLTVPPKQGSEAFPVSCCLKLCDIKVRKELLKGYSLQDKPLCPVKAVRFVTNNDLTICLDPSTLWAVKTMAFLNNKGTLQGNITTPNNNNKTLSYI
ncbi:C-C motif chemokine 8-like [Tachysurus fulvidraco]|uniref:C-C motif chemokine 8-like n=1 Tax=Tachysurus fulvidraco TaxID=1234273 RepID=UPI000F4FF846|nr:C-C motif chemokine 8-like [Tachysurus fulvidraco]